MNTKENIYEKALMGNRVGFGKRPAILVVDFQKRFTHERSIDGGDMSAQCIATQRLINVARKKNILIFHSWLGFRPDGADLGVWGQKCQGLRSIYQNTWDTEIDEHIEIQPQDIVFRKPRPSAFFGTDLLPMLLGLHIDTIIMCGCTVSGCLYASTVDSCSNGFRTIIPKDAVADRSQEVFDVFLWNIDQKYADVSKVDEIITQIHNLDSLEYDFLF